MRGLNCRIWRLRFWNRTSRRIPFLTGLPLKPLAGTVRFENEAEFTREKGAYRLVWRHGLIFRTWKSDGQGAGFPPRRQERKDHDRNGEVLAGGKAASVGIVPGKLPDNRQETLGQLAQMLETDVESMEKKLSAGWVKADSFCCRSKPFRRISGGRRSFSRSRES